MRRRKVLEELNMSVSTLSRLTKSNKIRYTKLDNGHFDYEDESVMEFKNGDKERKIAIYCRATPSLNNSNDNFKASNDLKNQKDMIISYLTSINQFNNNKIAEYFDLSGSYIVSDSSMMSQLIKDIIAYKIKTVYVLSFKHIPISINSLFQSICAIHNADIIFLDRQLNYGNVTEEDQQKEYSLIDAQYQYDKIYNKGDLS